MKTNLKEGKTIKAVNAAMKNVSTQLTNVDLDTFNNILSASTAELINLSEVTKDSAYEKYYASCRTGQEVKSNYDGISYEDFNSDNKVINILSDRYSLVQHEDLFKNVFDVLNDNSIEYDISKVYVDQRPGSNKIYGVLTLNGVSVDIDGSPVSPSIDVFNSTDGTLAAGILFGAYRFKCGNGMLIGESYGLEKVIHTPSAIKRLQFEKLFESAMQQFKDLNESIERMQFIKLETSHMETLKRLGFNSMFIKHYDHILEKYMIDKREDVKKDTLWGLYATATNYISNHIMRKSIREAIAQQNIINNLRISSTRQ